MDIIMTGYAGQKETVLLVQRCREQLLSRLPEYLIEAAGGMDRDCEPPESCLPVSRVKITAGGVCAALWILGEKLCTGLCADLRLVPIRQETVEICEILDLDPYVLRSDGAWLIAVRDAEEVLRQCAWKGIPAAKIGETTPEDARILSCGDVTRYLERI